MDATQWALECGSGKALNMVMLGCVLGSGSLPCTEDEFWKIVAGRIPPAFRNINTKAFFKGAEVAKGLRLAGRSA